MKSHKLPSLLLLVTLGSLTTGASLADERNVGDCGSIDCHGVLIEQPYLHGMLAEEMDCSLCHEETGEGHAYTLADEGRELCLSCHDEYVGVSLHEPATDDCMDCHDPHASPWRAHVNEALPPGNYAPWSEEAYGLCFQCHDTDLVEEAETDNATAFRQGRLNLHKVHVGREQKGRSCLLCHDPHASGNQALLRTRVPFGKWSMRIRFTPGETGGSCATSCHQERSYSREEN
jgi:predicted CXXCH cytochrome family protein